MNLRELVLDMLMELEKGKVYSNILIRNVLDKYDYLPAKDKAFIKRVTEGVLERRIQIDYVINAYSKIPVEKMKPLIRNLLRMSVYQLLFMDGVPDSAVCNEAVKLAVKKGFGNFIRDHSLDEFPQFLNVLKGDPQKRRKLYFWKWAKGG